MDRIYDRIPKRPRSGWTVVALLALLVLVVWLPDLDLAFGDSDDGRILGRFGLQARNFWESGPSASGFGSSMAPYGAAINYAHHPPLMNFVHIAAVGVLGESPVSHRLVGFAIGAATIWFLAAALRNRGLAWGPTLLACGAMASTGFFFVYMRQGGGFSLILAAAAATAYLRDLEDPPRWMMLAGAGLATVTAMQSWIAMAAMGLLIVWMFSRRRLAPVTLCLAAGGLVGVIVTASWILAATDLSELAGQVDTRTNTARFGFGEFLERQWSFAGRLTSGWLRWLMFPALIAGVVDRRTRPLTIITLAVAAAWTFGLQEGAWVHLLWNLPWVAPISIGLAALFDAVRRRLEPRSAGLVAAVMAIVIGVTFAGVVRGAPRADLLVEPAAAGELFAAHAPEPQTSTVWIVPGVSTARWISYYWDIPVRTLQEHNLADLDASDYILVNVERIPDHIPESIVSGAVDRRGRYALVPASTLSP